MHMCQDSPPGTQGRKPGEPEAGTLRAVTRQETGDTLRPQTQPQRRQFVSNPDHSDATANPAPETLSLSLTLTTVTRQQTQTQPQRRPGEGHPAHGWTALANSDAVTGKRTLW